MLRDAQPRGPTSPITVVIADDHRSFGEALEVALDKEQDLRVIEVVTDGQAAIDSASKEHPDVVLMDLQMPGVDGIEATRAHPRRGRGHRGDHPVGPGRRDLARPRDPGRRPRLPGARPRPSSSSPTRSAARTAGSRCTRAPRSRSRCAACAAAARRTATSRSASSGSPRASSRSCSAWPTATRPRRSPRELGMSKHTLRTHTQNVLTKLGRALEARRDRRGDPLRQGARRSHSRPRTSRGRADDERPGGSTAEG